MLQMDLSEISDSFRAGSDTYGVAPYIVLTAVPILAAVGITLFYQHHHGFAMTMKGPERLFYELCQAHQLSRSEVRLLRRMSIISGIANPAMLFLLQQQFDSAAKMLTGESDSTKTATEIESIRGRLFGFPKAKLRS